MPSMLVSRTTRLAVWLLGAGFFYYITFVQFGLLTLARARLGTGPDEMPVAMGLLTAGGLVGSLWAGGWVGRGGAKLSARLRLIAGCSALQVVWAALALGLSSALQMRGLCAVLGVTLGANSVATLSLVFDAMPARFRWLLSGWIVAALYLFANIPPLVFDGPQRIILFNAGLAAVTALLAWVGRNTPAVPEPEARDGVVTEPLRVWLPFLAAVVLLDSYTFQRLLSDRTLWTLSWGSEQHIWVNGSVHAVGAMAAGWLASRTQGPRLAGILAAGSLIATEAVLLSSHAATGGGYLLTGVYNVGVSAYFVLLLGLWPACLGPRPDRRLGWAVAVTCWLAAPTGIGLAMRVRATPALSFGVPLFAACAALLWLLLAGNTSRSPAVALAKEST